MGKLDGKVALITGGSSGIGFATASQLVREGAIVWVTGRDHERVAAAAAQLGPAARYFVADVASDDDMDRLVTAIAAEHARIDIVVANAAVMETAAIGEITGEQIDRVLAVNVRGVVFTVQKAVARMPDGGAVVLVGSLGASRGWPEQSVYAASKAAVRSLARTWTAELGGRGIRVNVVSPGPVATRPDDDHPELVALVPAGRLGTPDEIARAIVFLVSDDASYVRGSELAVDGGLGQI